MKKKGQAYILFSLLGLALSVPALAHADTGSAQHKPQKNSMKKDMKRQKKAEKKIQKLQNKAVKKWKKRHQTG